LAESRQLVHSESSRSTKAPSSAVCFHPRLAFVCQCRPRTDPQRTFQERAPKSAFHHHLLPRAECHRSVSARLRLDHRQSDTTPPWTAIHRRPRRRQKLNRCRRGSTNCCNTTPRRPTQGNRSPRPSPSHRTCSQGQGTGHPGLNCSTRKELRRRCCTNRAEPVIW